MSIKSNLNLIYSGAQFKAVRDRTILSLLAFGVPFCKMFVQLHTRIISMAVFTLEDGQIT